MEQFILSNGVSVPAVGFGTVYVEQVEGAFDQALSAGYRHIDTAAFYDNEAVIGGALERSGIPRQELFLTSKVWKTRLGYANAIASFQESLERLNTDYLDLFLIHWPRNELDGSEDWQALDLETWQALEDLYADGRVRAIGVSNFLPHHLIPLMDRAKIMPMVNQLEFHPGYPQTAAVAFCQDNNILVEAWSPLGRQRMAQEPVMQELAQKYGVSPAQICIRFALQCDILPLPRSTNPARMAQNLDVFSFSLEEADLCRLLTLPQMGWSGEHPDYPRNYSEVRNYPFGESI